MRATTQLTVPAGLGMTITLTLRVDEARELLEATKEVRAWPTGAFREVLRQSLSKATQAYDGEHLIEGR